MKKIFKGLAVLAATAAIGTGVAFAAGCGGSDGVYVGEYHYTNKYGATYGMVVEVTVKNNIITNVKDLTNDFENEHVKKLQGYNDDKPNNWTRVSAGWDDYFKSMATQSWFQYKVDPDAWAKYQEDGTIPTQEQCHTSYDWSMKQAAVWTNHESWLLQQYIGRSVADVLNINVFTDFGYSYDTESSSWVVDMSLRGEPYGVAGDYNNELKDSGLLLTGSTQGSGRLILAVQNALGKK